MATRVLSRVMIEALASSLPFGPWERASSGLYTQFFGTEILIEGVTLAQIIGGASPAVQAITTINFLWIYTPISDLRVGLHGVNAQTNGFTLAGGHYFTMDMGTISALNLYNTAAVPVYPLVAAGQV